MGRPILQIDGEQVRKLAAMHCTVQEIADFFGCSRETVYKRFSPELTAGRAQGKMDLRTQQFKAARNGSAAMNIWLGKQYLGQKDQQEIVAVDEEEKRLSDEEVDAMLKKITGDDIIESKDKTEKSSSSTVS